jgi:hypothetical protein
MCKVCNASLVYRCLSYGAITKIVHFEILIMKIVHFSRLYKKQHFFLNEAFVQTYFSIPSG